MSITRAVSYMKQELFIIPEHVYSSPVLVGSVLLIFLVFCVVFLFLFLFFFIYLFFFYGLRSVSCG